MSGSDARVPEYEVKDKNDEIVITIWSPLSKPKEAAFVLEKDVFTFDSSPYFLKIKLPHPVSDRFNQQAYDNDSKSYKLKLKKLNLKFQETSDEEEEYVDFLQETSTDVNNTSFDKNDTSTPCYGFANNYSKMFGKLYGEFSDVVNLPNPDQTSARNRRKLRLQEEKKKWNDDHYLADTMETNHLKPIFQYQPPWVSCPVKDELCDEEKEILTKLCVNSKNKKLPDSAQQERICEFQLIDVLYAYAYNKRTTEGDNTVESGWTINKISSTLSWFEVFENLQNIFLSCYRRSLTYPLYRNWNLCQLIHNDVASIVKIGPKQMTRCLIEVKEIFDESENRYLLNTLYINDLCNFAYHMKNERAMKLSDEIEKIKIKKYQVNKELPLLEMGAHLALQEAGEVLEENEITVNDIVEKIGNLNINRKNAVAKDAGNSSESDSQESSSSSASAQSSDNEN